MANISQTLQRKKTVIKYFSVEVVHPRYSREQHKLKAAVRPSICLIYDPWFPSQILGAAQIPWFLWIVARKKSKTQKPCWGHFWVWRNGRACVRKHSNDDMMAYKKWQMTAEMMREEKSVSFSWVAATWGVGRTSMEMQLGSQPRRSVDSTL